MRNIFERMNPKVLEQLHIFSIMFLSPITCAPIISLILFGDKVTVIGFIPYSIVWFWINTLMIDAGKYHDWMKSKETRRNREH